MILTFDARLRALQVMMSTELARIAIFLRAIPPRNVVVLIAPTVQDA